MKPTIIDAYEACAEAFNVSFVDMLSPYRGDDVAQARFAGWLIARDLLGMTFHGIGDYADRDHTSVMHGCQRAAVLLERDHDFAAAFWAAHKATNDVAAAVPVFRTRRNKPLAGHGRPPEWPLTPQGKRAHHTQGAG